MASIFQRNGIFFADFRMYVDEGVFIIEFTNDEGRYRGRMMNALHRAARGLPPESSSD